MHTYIRLGQIWTVGHYSPDGRWYPLRDFSSEERAVAFINYLNGGDGKFPNLED
jgi:hypothetical protein